MLIKRCYGVTVLVPRPNDKCQWDDLTLMLHISESGRAKVALDLSGNFKFSLVSLVALNLTHL